MNWLAGVFVLLAVVQALALGWVWERWGWQRQHWLSVLGIAFVTAAAVVWA